MLALFTAVHGFAHSPEGPGHCLPPWLLGEEHVVAHVDDVDKCVELTQTAREVYLAEGAKAMTAYLESTYAYEDGIHDEAHVQTPYAFVFLPPADLDVSVDDFTRDADLYVHPFYRPLGLLNLTFPAGSSMYTSYGLRARNARTKPEGFVWTNHNDLHTTKSQIIDGVHVETDELHRKDYIDVILDGLKGTELEGRRLIVSCGYAELGVLGPTQATA